MEAIRTCVYVGMIAKCINYIRIYIHTYVDTTYICLDQYRHLYTMLLHAFLNRLSTLLFQSTVGNDQILLYLLLHAVTV